MNQKIQDQSQKDRHFDPTFCTADGDFYTPRQKQTKAAEESYADAFLKELEADKALTPIAPASSELPNVEASRSRKTYEGTNIKIRNPIMVMMLISSIVSDSLKNCADGTKEAVKLAKKEWKLFSEKQSANYLDGKNNMESVEKTQNYAMWATGGGMAARGLLGYGFNPANDNIISKGICYFANCFAKDLDTAQKLVDTASSSISSGMAGKGQMEMQVIGQGIQHKEAIFQHEVGARNSDYQNLSQLTSSDSQAKDGANEKGMQLARIAAQMLTGSPA